MSNISMVEAKLPPGFRFHPRDEELVCEYLLNKINASDSFDHLLIEVDLNKCEPWDLPEEARVGGKEWYFYSKRDRKYATGVRTNRATARGYWKATGKDRRVVQNGCLVGMRKTLVFYQGRAPKGRKSDWVMHEFRLLSPSPLLQEDWVLCRVFYKKREEIDKSNINGTSCSYDDTGCSSSSLPPLMDDSYITFDQIQPNNYNNNNNKLLHHDHEQVPCFSIFSHNQTSLIFPHFDPFNNLINLSFGQLPATNFDNINDFSSHNNKTFIKPMDSSNSDNNNNNI